MSPKVYLVMIENQDKKYNIEFRSIGNYRVDLIAKKFGGGGHINASGCIIEKSKVNQVLKEVRKVVNT
jgi:phosphoesterase RecJ-like protein